jgi:hypothetical protein
LYLSLVGSFVIDLVMDGNIVSYIFAGLCGFVFLVDLIRYIFFKKEYDHLDFHVSIFLIFLLSELFLITFIFLIFEWKFKISKKMYEKLMENYE